MAESSNAVCVLELEDAFDDWMLHSSITCAVCSREKMLRLHGPNGPLAHIFDKYLPKPSTELNAQAPGTSAEASETPKTQKPIDGVEAKPDTTSLTIQMCAEMLKAKNAKEQEAPKPAEPKVPEPDKNAPKWQKIRLFKQMGMSNAEAQAKLSEEIRLRAKRMAEEGEKPPEKEKANVPLAHMPWVSIFLYKRFSLLTHEQQKRFIAIEVNRLNTGKFKYRDNAFELEKFKERLVKERVEFQKCVHSIIQGLKNKDARPLFLPSYAKSFAMDRSLSKARQIKDLGAVNFCQLNEAKKIMMPPEMIVERSPAWLNMESKLLAIGSPGAMKLPDIQRKVLVPDKNVSKCYPSEEATQLGIDTDPNIEKLVSKYQPQIVLSAGAARLLLCQQSLTRGENWEIPVTVKETFINGRPVPIVYVLKPLPARGLHHMQKQLIYTKYALKSLVLNKKIDYDKINKYKKQTQETEDPFKVDDGIDFGVEGVEMDSFLVPKRHHSADSSFDSSASAEPTAEVDDDEALQPPPPKRRGRPPKKKDGEMRSDEPKLTTETKTTEAPKRKGRPPKKKPETERESVDSPPRLTIETDDAPSTSRATRSSTRSPEKSVRSETTPQSPSAKSESTPQSPSAKCESAPQSREVLLVDDILRKMTSIASSCIIHDDAPQDQETDASEEKSAVDKEAKENPQDYDRPRTGKQWNYALWTLKDYRLLIRSNTDGFLRTSLGNSKGVTRTIPASILPRIEYYPEHGAQILNKEEWLFHIWTAILKSSKMHVIVRCHFKERFLLGYTHWSQKEWNSKSLGPERRVLLQRSTRRLHAVCKKLVELSPGNYLLQYQNNAEFMTLLREQSGSERGGTNLIDKYDANNPRVFGEESRLPSLDQRFLGIDEDVVLTWHRIKGRVPATFEPRREGFKADIYGKTKTKQTGSVRRQKKKAQSKRVSQRLKNQKSDGDT